MNTVMFAGRLGKDPESRFTTNGQKVTTFSVATNVFRSGQEETIWWRVTVWGDRFDKMLSYMKKGSAILVVGHLTRAPETWTDNSGAVRVGSLEVTADALHFSPFGAKDEQSNVSGGGGWPAESQQQPQQQPPQQQPPQQQQPPTPMGFGGGNTPAAGGFNPTGDEEPLPF